MKKTSKIITILIIAVMLLVGLTQPANAYDFSIVSKNGDPSDVEELIKAGAMNETKFMPDILLDIYTLETVGELDENISKSLS